MVAAFSSNNSTNGRSEVRAEVKPPALLRTGVRALYAVAPPLGDRLAARLFFTPPPTGPGRPGPALPGGRPFALRAAGVTVHGEAAGEGPAVLLVHGWGGRGTQLAPLGRALLEAGLAVAIFDGPAHGRSGGGTTNLLRMADALAAVARHVGARAAIGHSFGGAALGIALSRRLVALDAAVTVGAPSSPFGFFGAFARAFGLPPEAGDRIRRGLEARVGVSMASLDAGALLPTVRVPGLVVHDADDREVPYREAEAIAAAWPGARLRRTEGLGHRRILRDPALATELAAFVSGHLARCGCGRPATGNRRGEPTCASCRLALHLEDRDGRAGSA
ncbi:MAG: alpha/beta fold hydrolase [Anaeromyxobacteraceae bacterium]